MIFLSSRHIIISLNTPSKRLKTLLNSLDELFTIIESEAYLLGFAPIPGFLEGQGDEILVPSSTRQMGFWLVGVALTGLALSVGVVVYIFATINHCIRIMCAARPGKQ